ncbi:hypothetical protein Golax_025398 [Gossypium laxum]|uniref:Uncharacterized protein n=1 Tax=Gossypium laxum TaxID=34288 RepID=A0A7J9B2U8_9ROSI|nr:hypothetical protein [Gossypium laxum]
MQERRMPNQNNYCRYR